MAGRSRREKALRRARRKQRAIKPKAPLPNQVSPQDALRHGWAALGHFSNIAPFLPYALVATVTGSLAWFLGWSAPLMIILLLAATSLAFTLLKIVPDRRLSYMILGIILLAGMALGAWQYDSYRIEAQEVRAGLEPNDIGDTMATGVVVSLTFRNDNNFPIWIMSDRRVTSVDTPSGTLISQSDQKPVLFVRKAHSVFGISDDPIKFATPIVPTQFAGGTIDYHLCYGRSEHDLHKGLTIKGRYQPELLDGGSFNIKWDATEYKEGPCD